jgi:hypothetical protein
LCGLLGMGCEDGEDGRDAEGGGCAGEVGGHGLLYITVVHEERVMAVGVRD